MKKFLIAIMLALNSPLLVGCLSDAWGEIPVTTFGNAERRDEQGAAPGKGGAPFRTIGSDSYASSDGTNELGFADRSLIVVDCTTTQWVCVTMMDGADFSFASATGVVTDAASDSADYPADGISDCRRIQAGSSVNVMVELEYFRTSGQTAGAVGRRINTCIAHAGRPCRSNSDCPTGNCGTAGVFDDITQAFLAGHNDCAWNLQKHQES